MLAQELITQEAYDLLKAQQKANDPNPEPKPEPGPEPDPVDHFTEYVNQCSI